MTSPAWQAFLNSNFFGDPFNAWHDGVETHVLAALSEDEQLQAEDVFIQGLPDTRCIEGLRWLVSTKALPQLKQIVKSGSSSEQIAAARAVQDIEGGLDETGLDELIAVLDNTNAFWGMRADAAKALSHYRSERAAKALLKALKSDDKLIRCYAAESLGEIYGLEVDGVAFMREESRAAAIKQLKADIKGKPIVGE